MAPGAAADRDAAADDGGADGDAAEEKPDVDLEASHRENRARLLEAMREQEERERLERKRRLEMPEADLRAAEAAKAGIEKKKKSEAMVDALEVTSSKFGYHGGDEFKQVALADESHLEEQRMLHTAKAKAAKEAQEAASFEAEASALDTSRQGAGASWQAAIQRKQRAEQEAELAKKRARPGVRLAVRRAGAGEPTGDAAGAGAASAGAGAGTGGAGVAGERSGARDDATGAGSGLAAGGAAAAGGLAGLGGYASDDGSSASGG